METRLLPLALLIRRFLEKLFEETQCLRIIAFTDHRQSFLFEFERRLSPYDIHQFHERLLLLRLAERIENDFFHPLVLLRVVELNQAVCGLFPILIAQRLDRPLAQLDARSEERRVGKDSRCRGSSYSVDK